MGKSNLEPGKAGPGRPKGSKDRLPREVKERVMAVWDKLEAEGKGLLTEARKDRQWFYSTFVRPLLPKEATVTGKDGGPIQMVVSWADSEAEDNDTVQA